MIRLFILFLFISACSVTNQTVKEDCKTETKKECCSKK